MKNVLLTLITLLFVANTYAIGPITGTNTLCPGSSITLSDVTPGGTWSSSAPAIATVGSSTGIVTGITSGFAVITYSVGASYVTDSVTIEALPAYYPLLAGSDSICAGGTGTNLYLTGSQTGVSYQLVHSGVPVGLPLTGTGSSLDFGIETSAGYYTVIATNTSTLCAANMGGKYIVEYIPGPITGSTAICLSSTSALSHTVPGGIWSSSNPTIASVGSSSGIVTGNAPGSAVITYNIITGCTVTTTVNVVASLSAIAGPSHACIGASITLTDPLGAGIWSSSNTAVATVGTGSGIVTGVALGSANISYTIGGSCGSVYKTVTVSALPNAYTLFFGSDSICTGGTGTNINLSGSQIGVSYQLYRGTSAWGYPVLGSGAAISFASTYVVGMYDATGIDTASGCIINYGPVTLTSYAGPGPITGTTGICIGGTSTLSNSVSGGTWSSSNTAVATIGSSTGVVTGIAPGSAVITYTLSTGCHIVATVNVSSSISAIVGFLNTCIAQPDTLTDPAAGGYWSSSTPAVATIGASTGIVTGVSAGTTIITYSIGGTCGSVMATVTVHPSPAPITGINSRCLGATTTLYDVTSGGTWSSLNTAVATISSTGFVTSISAGLSDIYYTLSTGCKAHTVMTIDDNPVITGPDSVCVGNYIRLITSSGNYFSSNNVAIASVSNDTVFGSNTGTVAIKATNWSTSCSTSHAVTVTSYCSGTPLASITIASDSAVCGGTFVTLSLPGASVGCGVIYQWQSSPDSITWTNIPGATHIPYNHYTNAPLYYRCKVTCYSTGLSAYSNPVHVGVMYSITSHYTLLVPDYYCDGPDYQLTTCGVSSSLRIVNFFGDGSSDTTVTGTTILVHNFHNYAAPGTYTVKQVLYYGVLAVDSVSFTYTYNYCRTLPVNFYFDANNDCSYNAGDARFLMPVLTEVDSNGIPIDTLSTTAGFYYKAYGSPGTYYTFRVIGTPSGLHVSCPSSGVATDTIQTYVNNYAPIYFGINCDTMTAFDLAQTQQIYCARHMAYGTIFPTNTWCPGENTVVTMTFSPKYVFGSSYPAPYSVAGNVVTWHVNSLSVHTWLQPIWFNLQLPTGALWLTTGDTIQTSYKITPYAGDVDTINNYTFRVDNVISSYDPNEMAVTPQGNILPCTPLKYDIIFQNTGNDTARNITVLDTLSNSLDPHSLRILSSSSVMNTAIIYDSLFTVVKFDFPHINLPDSSHHNQCYGSLSFTIKAKSGLTDGTTIFNHAGIIFDDNPAVLTDTVENIIGINPVSGPSSVCVDSGIILLNAFSGGVWSASNAHATVLAGAVSGISAGTDTMFYMVSNSCTSRTATKVITINPLPDGGSITGAASICVGSSVTLADATPGGTWSSTNPYIATVADGVVAGSAPGTATIIYTVINGCGIATAITTLDVVPALVPVVSIATTPGIYIIVGLSDTLTAVVTGSGGLSSYQWYQNGTLLIGATSASYIVNLPFDGDNFTCTVTNSDPCIATVTGSVVLLLNNVGVATLVKNQEIKLSPNPNKGSFTLSGTINCISGRNEIFQIEVMDVVGQVIYRTTLLAINGKFNEKISLPTPASPGVYLVNVHSDSSSQMFRCVVQQ